MTGPASSFKDNRKKPARKRERQECVRIAGACVLLGMGLLTLSIPRTIAALEAVVAAPVLAKIDKEKPFSKAELRDSIQALERALVWVKSPRYFKDLGTVELVLAQGLPFADSSRADLLAASGRHLLEGLAASPVDGLAWYKLAQIRQLRGDDGRSIANALMQSADMAPNMRPLWVGRTMGLILYRPFLTPDELPTADSQMRVVWRADTDTYRKALFNYLQGNANALGIIENALETDSDAKANYEKIKSSSSSPGIRNSR